jgi:hypothetical protein
MSTNLCSSFFISSLTSSQPWVYAGLAIITQAGLPDVVVRPRVFVSKRRFQLANQLFDQRQEVFVIPHQIGGPLSLIFQGAVLHAKIVRERVAQLVHWAAQVHVLGKAVPERSCVNLVFWSSKRVSVPVSFPLLDQRNVAVDYCVHSVFFLFVFWCWTLWRGGDVPDGSVRVRQTKSLVRRKATRHGEQACAGELEVLGGIYPGDNVATNVVGHHLGEDM